VENETHFVLKDPLNMFPPLFCNAWLDNLKSFFQVDHQVDT
jgi:hypothetical protein